MKNNASIIYKVTLVVGDGLAILIAFTVAYILRVSISHRPLSAHVHATTYISILVGLLPFWILIFALLGLYSSRVVDRRFSEVGRIVVGTLIGILSIISYSYMFDIKIFPARLVAIYAFFFALVFILVFRTIVRGVRRQMFSYGRGINRLLLVGDTTATCRLVETLDNWQVTGYRVIGVVGGTKHEIGKDAKFSQFKEFSDAVHYLKNKLPDTIIQTELYSSNTKNDEVLTFAQQHHIAYGFVPGNSELFVGNIEADLFYNVPLIAVHQTALIGWGRVIKRLTDLLLGGVLLIIACPFMLVFAVLIWFSDGIPAMFKQERLSRFNKKFRVYKFRTHKKKYSGLEPEAAFTKMGKPELIDKYRNNGDYLEKDPRVTAVGRFLRRWSLDELPQLFNVVKGDISLVGPRALVPYELEKYDQKNLITSVKSGLTGLAQISGVKDLSFIERRRLDLYYVENWTFWGDMVILAKTFWVVVRHRGTRS
ncbi:MAG TPA: sugar transferase [Candidatus Sulfotelmatobacter sp.]|nr:sugar transferase [Candidatus Sulfotelmatobacter sp.]